MGPALLSEAPAGRISTWTTDFRDDLPKTDVPMLVIQGDDDQVLPYLRRANGCPA